MKHTDRHRQNDITYMAICKWHKVCRLVKQADPPHETDRSSITGRKKTNKKTNEYEF